MNDHGIDLCRCGAVVTRCRCMDHEHRRVTYDTCGACRPGTRPVPIHGQKREPKVEDSRVEEPRKTYSRAVEEFARLALQGRRVSQEAWDAARDVADEAVKVVHDSYVSKRDIDAVVQQIIRDKALGVVHRPALDELMAALDAWGADKSYPTDSATLRRVKDAYRNLKHR